MPSSSSGHQLASVAKPDIEKPRWDQNTYYGRAAHFFVITNPLNILCSAGRLQKSKEIVEKYRTTRAVIFWQWINQSFNAIVNYTNRSGENPISNKQLLISYASATGGALATALGLNSLVKKAPPLIGRFVPFVAVAAANCVNIPLMRIRELQNGITIYTESGEEVGESKLAAQRAITMVVVSRIAMATPGMILPPFLMNRLEKGTWLRKRMYLSAPIQVGLVGLFFIFATPMCCALFPQQSSMLSHSVEKRLQEKLDRTDQKRVYYNKGL